MPNSPLADATPDEVALMDGKLVSKRDRVAHGVDCGSHAAWRWSASSTRNPPPSPTMVRHAHNTHSAIFAEVKVDAQLGVIRVTRVVSAVAAGRILNLKTASSQSPRRSGLGYRHGAARGNVDRPQCRSHHERQHRRISRAGERRRARHRNHLCRRTTRSQSLGVKGLGEIGIVGVAAAIANAVYHATYA